MSAPDLPAAGVPREPLLRLFLRFLRFGFLAWGGPVAQIAMIRQELVEEERWVTKEHFNRTLALYQVLPGPEAHELCVYFGMLARGRVGGLLAGLGFMLPGLVLMLALSWLYLRTAVLDSPWVTAALAAVQAAVTALILRAVHRIGTHAVHSSRMLLLAAGALLAQLAGVPFLVTLAWAGLVWALEQGGRRALAAALTALLLVASVALLVRGLAGPGLGAVPGELAAAGASAEVARVGPWRLLLSGLKAGLLTFGGAYTAVPLLRRDAVVEGGWMTDAQFLDGIALGGLLPAPLIIFGTFVGYVGGGLSGGLLATLGIFAPAFSFSLLAHGPLERLVSAPRVHHFLDGVTAGVVGLIAATALLLLRGAVTGPFTAAVFLLALLALFRARHRLAPMAVLGAAAAAGLLLHAAGGR
jgi:chromate transporter